MAPKQKGQKMDLGTFLTDACMPPKPPSARGALKQRKTDLQHSPGILGGRDGRYANAL
ncbi:MAG: hypothetical protein Q9171_006835 [Xanthocarpia ochracea]